MKRILTALALVFFLVVTGSPQDETSSALTVRSTPPGAEIVLSGDALITGITPTAFRYPFFGEYELKLSKYGYEKYKTRLVLDPSKQLNLDITLTPKTGFKAAIRSMFIPGWGQSYTEQKTKSFAFGLLFAGSVVAYFTADNNFREKEDRYNKCLEEYDAAAGGTSDDWQRRLDALTHAQEEAYDAESVRRVTIGAVVGVWSLNILDAFLFTPREKGLFTVKGMTVTPSVGAEGVNLSLITGF